MALSIIVNPPAVRIVALRDASLSWRIPGPADTIRGIRLLSDGPRGSGQIISVVRSIVRANHRIAPLDALALAVIAHDAAVREHVAPDFIAATLLQESAFDPNAVSSAGALGIAQFTPATAAEAGIDPFEPHAAIAGAARLLARYVRTYAPSGPQRYALALAAYNAGPGAVAYYHGVPPYAETHGYIDDIYERWLRLIGER